MRNKKKLMTKNTEQLEKWGSDFGRQYTNRNTLTVAQLDDLYQRYFGITRTELNRLFIGGLERSIRMLEVGSNTGNQLLCLQEMGFKNLYGIEPQDYAIELSKSRTHQINIIKGNAFDIPFKDNYFDLVFTSGVLIHINPNDIEQALREICRCTRKYIWGLEYYSEEYEEIEYRGEKNLLWKANFPKLYLDLFKNLELIQERRLKYLTSNNWDVMFLLQKKDH
jgi:pseudaminic acid biosynthesis-associated methylase